VADGKKERIAILGGGVGALTAAFELTNIPNWQDRYEITVYQQGWRLGGKGASARNPERNWRIEEHGPHVWFGFYFNAFRHIADAYRYCAENGLLPEGSFQSWEQAFSPRDTAAVLDYAGGRWSFWNLALPRRPGSPVEPGDSDLWSLLDSGLRMLAGHLETIQSALGPRRLDGRRGFLTKSLMTAHALAARLHGERSGLRAIEPASPFDGLLDLLKTEAARMGAGWWSWLGRLGLYVIGRILGGLIHDMLEAIRDLVEDNDDLRHAWQVLDIGIAAVRGMLADGVLFEGYDAIEDIDLSRWLEKHGCCDPWSPLIRSIYDSGAHYEGGRSIAPGGPNRRPPAANLAAGTALHSMLRMFAGYAGSYSYRMNAGMGETIFTPLYLALRHRGVKFAFFHRVRGLRLNEARDAVAAVDLDVQASVTAGPLDYQPLLAPFRGLLCWPNHPCFEQLAEGQEIERRGLNLESAWCDYRVAAKTLSVGPNLDCDKVILGVSVASLPAISQELAAASSRWRDMLAAIKTVQTQFCEIWMKRPVEQLRPGGSNVTAEGFIEPVDTWLDMSQVLPREGWPEPQGSVHYFVGPLADQPEPPPETPSDFPAEQWKRVFDTMRAFVEDKIPTLWPLAHAPGEPGRFDWDLMRGPEGARGAERLRHQYVRANVDPADRYVLSVAGSKRFRLRSDASGFGNLFLAGDWTLNGIDAGSVEAAVMSGMQASQGISGYPKEILGGWAEMDRPARRPAEGNGRFHGKT
jgi:uncharacterized protein with NAD-binding domain and iron-sulfur cluster